MRLEQLTIILEVARVGSMSQAAKNLSLSQPSLSTAIASLEKELGLKLFNRSSRGITPTPSGQEVLDIAQSFFDQMRQLRQLAPENTRQPERLEIAASPSAASTILLEAIRQFRQLYPDVQITLSQCRFSELLEKMAHSPDIIGLTSYDASNSDRFDQILEDADLISALLYKHSFCHIVSSTNPLVGQEKVYLKDISRYPFIFFTTISEQPSHPKWEQIYADFGIYMPPDMACPPSLLTLTSLEAVKRLTARGCGIALLPRTALYHDLYAQNGQLVALEVEDAHLDFDHYLLRHRQSQLTPAAQTLVTIIKHIYRQIAASEGGA